MSVNYYTYIGPYIRVYNPETPSTEEYYSCPNDKCNSHTSEVSSKFCPDCGTPIKLITVPDKARIDFDAYEEFDDKLAEALREYKPEKCEDYQYFIPNQGKIGLHNDDITTIATEATQMTIATEYDRLNDKFKKEIARLREVFGDKNVEIKWGVLGWLS